jgi:hypothetical protein
MQVSHFAVRVLATITLVDLATIPIFDKYIPAYSHAIANSTLGRVGTFWAIAVPLLLPFFVGFEIWWGRKSGAKRKALWIDAILAICCICLLCVIVLYSWAHYVML